jgi:Skp family chaperone for outer membrane proteins
MNKFLKAMMLASLPMAVSLALPTAASAQTAASVAVANVEDALQRSNAFAAAAAQIKTTYKAQIDAAEARQKVLEAELRSLVAAYQTAQAAPNASQTALDTQGRAIQAKQQSAQRELQNLEQPYVRAQAFAVEQIGAKLEQAVKAAMTKRKVTLVVNPQATVYSLPTADITNDIVVELNALVPSVSIAVPANWRPGGQGQGNAAPAPATTTPPKPQGR